MPGRNNKSCRKRWLHSLDPKLRKGRWTSEEDATLRESVAKYGKRWYEVARALPGRTDDQCAKRYKEAVDPSIRRDPWTGEEDEQLWTAFKKHGNKWHTIANTLQGRPAIHCRNRLQSLQRTRDATSASTKEPPNGSDSLPPPSLSNLSTPAPLSSSGTPIPSTAKTHLPREPPEGKSSAVPLIPASEGEANCQLELERFPEPPRKEGFLDPPRLQHGFPTVICPPTAESVRCWQESITPTELWKNSPTENPTIWENLQFYQHPQLLTVHIDPAFSFNNTSPALSFTMTCPVPHCCFQCQTVVEIWRHITWSHVRPRPDDGIAGIVEKVVLGSV